MASRPWQKGATFYGRSRLMQQVQRQVCLSIFLCLFWK